MTEKEILLETIDYYKTHQRGVNEEGSCVYLDNEGNMCSVGRCLLPEIREELKNDTREMVSDLDHDYGSLDEILIPKYQGHSIHFWEKLQTFHDEAEHWDDRKISEEGKKYLIWAFGIDI